MSINKKSSSLEIKSHNKNNVSKRVMLLIFSVFVVSVMTACSSFKKAPKETPSPTPTETVTPTPSPTPSVTPEPVYDGDEFITKLKENGYKYTTDGDTISFNKEDAENLFRLMDGLQEKVFADLDDEEKETEMQKYMQEILIYVADSIDPTIKEVVSIVDQCKSITPEQANLMTTLFDKARNIALLSVNEPINGKIIDSKEQIGKFSDEYIEATQDFLATQKELLNLEKNPVYNSLSAWEQYLVSSLVLAANHAYIPAYLLENGKDAQSYNISYIYTDQEGNEIRILPIMTENGTMYKNEKTGEIYTEFEMELCLDKDSTEYVPSMKFVGLYPGEVKTEESQFINAETVREEAKQKIYAEVFPKEADKVKKINP